MDIKPVAWMYPHIISFKDATRTSCPVHLQPEIEGTVAWAPELGCGDAQPVIDKYGVPHSPEPLYGQSAIDALTAEVERLRVFERDRELYLLITHSEAKEWEEAEARAERAEAEVASLRKLCLEAVGRVSVTPDGGDLHDRLIAAYVKGEG